ncbi:MAG: hypothetical protein ACK5MQ_12360 [Pikeienuella sp.]
MEQDPEEDMTTEPQGGWPTAAARRRAADFLDLWERQVSEHARRGPAEGAGDAAGR